MFSPAFFAWQAGTTSGRCTSSLLLSSQPLPWWYGGLARAWLAQDLGSEAASEAWQERCYALQLKRLGPSVLGAESWLPLTSLAAILEKAVAH